MNVALPAVVLFLLVAPGFIYHHFSQASEVREADMTPFSTTVLKSIAIACVLNALVGAIAAGGFGYELYLGDAMRLLSGASTANAVPPERYRWLNEHPWPVFVYFATTHFLAFVLAMFRRAGVKRWKLDHPDKKFSRYFRQPAPWHYLFSGIDVVGGATPAGCLVSAVVSLKDANYLYTGLLEDYEIKADGELNRIILSAAMRRRLDDDRRVTGRHASGAEAAQDLFGPEENARQAERFYPIEGDRLILRASEWTTLNVKFIAEEAPSADVQA